LIVGSKSCGAAREESSVVSHFGLKCRVGGGIAKKLCALDVESAKNNELLHAVASLLAGIQCLM
jgi:hypothetical protein